VLRKGVPSTAKTRIAQLPVVQFEGVVAIPTSGDRLSNGPKALAGPDASSVQEAREVRRRRGGRGWTQPSY